MSVVSNLYAAKLYSEHPVAIWPLDDDVSYVSLITDTQRKFESNSPYAGWSISNGVADDSLPLPDTGSPFNSDIYAGINGNIPTVDNTIIEAISPDLFTFDSCNQDLETFCISMYIYQPSTYFSGYEIGYEYYDDFTSSWIQVTTEFPSLEREGWINIQDTFSIQEFDPDYCHVIFRAIANTGGVTEDYNIIVNGITVGQWSENFASSSLGAVASPAPVSSGLGFDAVPADQYGVLSNNAYYLVEDNKLLAKNYGIPMIYGSENITKLFPSSDGSPSLIVPNEKMFTEEGRYQNFTFETWIKIRPNTSSSRKIIGPIDTSDGIYVSEGFITLVVNNNFVSHNISDWYRPMLLHVIMKNNAMTMLINGEQVGELSFSGQPMDVSQSDWIGFYSYSDIDIFEIDCVSIFPYSVPVEVARKRFVWGQGTDPIELINDSFDGDEAVIQFSNSNYINSKIYPDKERWDAGYYNNLVATTNSLSVPDYSLPNIYLGGREVSEWYEDNKNLNDLLYPSGGHPLFFSFRPNIESSTWEPVDGTNWTEQCYLNFPTMSFISSPLSAFYAIFEVESEVLSSRPLIKILNTISGKSFDISIDGYNVTYNFDGQELDGTGFSSGTSHFVVGFHIPTISEAFNFELASFFGSPEFLQMFVGGDGSTTFEGKIYRIGFSDQINFSTISDHFDTETGIINSSDSALFEEHYASYTLSPFFRYNTYFLDISVYAQWEEYFPLSSFASYITKRDGTRSYDIDYMQINYGYPSLIQILETSVDNPDWTYQELFDAYNDPIQKSYEILDNSVLSGYSDYSGLASNIVTEYQIDTSGSSVSAYVTFQLLSEGADEPLSSFSYTKNLTDSYTIYAEEENTNINPYKAYNTKFRIIDGTVIYPPKKINFENVAMVVHFEIQQSGIISNPLKIKNLEISSKTLNENGLTPIGTKTGKLIYPYVKSGIYYDGKSKNPVMLGRENLPYLYLTEKSGIRVLETSSDKQYGVIIPINSVESQSYSLGAIQFFMRYSVIHPIITNQPVFTLTYNGGTVEFVITPDQTGQRFLISARDQLTKQEFSDLKFYQNGIETVNPYIANNEWNSLGISFNTPLDFYGFAGSMNLLHGCNFNNVSFFRPSGLNEFTTVIPRNWSDVLYGDQEIDPLNIVDWQNWYDENGSLSIPNNWKDVYVLSQETDFSITPSDIYSAYCGTNILVMDDDSGMSIVNDDFTMFADQSWLKVVQNPV